MSIYIVVVAKKNKNVDASSSLEALQISHPTFKWGNSEMPRGVYEAGSYDGTIAEPFLAQVRNQNGVWDWFVNLDHPNARYWRK